MKLCPKMRLLVSISFLIIYLCFHIINLKEVSLINPNEEEEYQLVFMDQPAPKSQRQRLEFIHITKTGGSAIESLASSHNITWGLCHFTHSYKLNCVNTHHVPWREYFIGTAWHAPPKVINALLPIEENPYAGADLFTVVRNPYDRAISEYYCKFFGMEGSQRNNDPEVMNEWIQNMIVGLEELPIKHYYKSPETQKFSSKKVSQIKKKGLRMNIYSYKDFYLIERKM